MMKVLITLIPQSSHTLLQIARRASAALQLLLGGLLAGCSALQIDVDVYKGALAQTQEVQLQQYASMAMSAKPLIERLRDMAEDELRDCAWLKKFHAEQPQSEWRRSDNSACSPASAANAWQFLGDLLALYEHKLSDTNKFEALHVVPPTTDQLFTEHKCKVEKYLNQVSWMSPRWTPKGLTDLTEKYMGAGDETRKAATTELNQALIFFAQRILFMVNQQSLFQGLDTSGNGERKAQTAVLQSLGNTLLIHADDLQRQLKRTADQVRHAPSERAAAQDAAVIAPSIAYDQIERALASRAAIATSPANAPTPQEREELKQLELDLNTVNSDLSKYREGIAPLIAAYRTLEAEPAAELGLAVADIANTAAALADREAINNRHGTAPIAVKDNPNLLSPLLSWLDLEQVAGVVVVPNRPTRLENTGKYLLAEKARLIASVPETAATQKEVLVAVKQYVTTAWVLATKQLDGYNQQAKELKEKIQPLKTKIDVADQATKVDQINKDNRTAVQSVLKDLRSIVLPKADQLKTTNSAAVLDLLKINLRAMVPGKDGKPTKEAIEAAQAAVDELPQLSNPLGNCSTESKATTSQMDIIDCKIATLRAQRVAALASNDSPKADNLLSAINAAYEHRAELVYLRPASTYLSGIYSANDLQDGAASEQRNMLWDVNKYSLPEGIPEIILGDTRRAKRQLEKLHWQNINTIKLNGSGATNYVLAKDDVGNWYIKSYGSDPEVIIKSATSLALFNSGKGFDSNLMRRFDLQRQLDDSKNTGDKTSLRTELATNNSQNSLPLLKVRDRYQARYQADTEAHAKALLNLLRTVQTAVEAKLDEPLVKEADSAEKTCSAETKKSLRGPNRDYLEAPLNRLKELLDKLPIAQGNPPSTDDVAKAKAHLAKLENEIQLGMNALHLYVGQLPTTLMTTAADTCDRQWLVRASTEASATARASLRAFATARKQGIERYEDALTSIAASAADQ